MNQQSSRFQCSMKIGDYETKAIINDDCFEGKKAGETKIWILRKYNKILEPTFSNNINCVQISDLVTNNKNEKFIVCEKCDYNLDEYMKKRKQFWFTVEQIYDIVSQIINGIMYLRKTNQIKSPILSPSCILIKKTGDLEIIKIDSFLLSELKSDKYLSPEQINQKLQGTQEQILIYQLGIILYQLCFASYPKELITPFSFHQFLEKQPFRCPKIEKPNWQSLINMIEKMIVFKANERITLNELSMDSKLQPRFKKVSHFLIDFKKKIGSGMQGIIYHALDLDTETQCCAKVLENSMIETQKEIDIYKNLIKIDQHPNIINILDLQYEEQQTFIILELGDENLEQFCQKKKIDDETIYTFLSQIVDGYLHLKSANIMHRDLKPQNILIKYVNNQPIVKIIDFGVGKIMGGNKLTQTLAGTPLYSAPEVLLGLDYSDQCDIYSLGAMLYQIVYGKLYFNPQSYEQLISYVTKLKDIPFKCPQANDNNQVNSFFQILIENMLVYKDSERLTWEELKEITKALQPQFKKEFQREWRYSLLRSNNANLDLKYLDSIQIFSSKVEFYLWEEIKRGQPSDFINDLQSLMIFVTYLSYGAFSDFYELSQKQCCMINNVTFSLNHERDISSIKKVLLLAYFEMMFQWVDQFKGQMQNHYGQKILDQLLQIEQLQRITIMETHFSYVKFYQDLKQNKSNEFTKLPIRLIFFLEKMANLFRDYPLENRHSINYSELQCKILIPDIFNNYLAKSSIIIKK